MIKVVHVSEKYLVMLNRIKYLYKLKNNNGEGFDHKCM